VKAVGALQEAVGLSIGPNYRSNAHIAGIDLEKVSRRHASRRQGQLHRHFDEEFGRDPDHLRERPGGRGHGGWHG
jgi:hypothetical protein